MGLLSSILLAPFTGPWDGTMWTLDKVRRSVEEELTDDTEIKEDFMRLQLELEAGDIDDVEYLRREQVIMQRLRDVREWREKLGMAVGGGPVRVARDDDEAR
ncbi:MAG: gas vesicle protein GvpG [Gemmatimonadaceae bacterium]